MRIKVYPDQSGENQFIQNLRRQLGKIEGARVEGVPLDHGRLLLRLPRELLRLTDYTVVNWLENNVCSKNGRLSALGCLKFVGFLLLFRITCKNLIYIRHNHYPHRLKSRHSGIAQSLVDRATSLLTVRVALSEHMVDKGYRYVPHPLYRFPKYETDSRDEGNGDISGRECYVIFGTISRYKGIEKVVECWAGRRRLLVFGKVGDAGYLDELKTLSSGRNITIRGGLLSDAAASRIISESLGVILPHDSDEMIVSGAFFYSIALGMKTYAVNNAFYGRVVRNSPFPGLKLFDGAEDLVEHLAAEPSKHTQADRIAIKKYAHECFGEEVGVAAWENIILHDYL